MNYKHKHQHEIICLIGWLLVGYTQERKNEYSLIDWMKGVLKSVHNIISEESPFFTRLKNYIENRNHILRFFMHNFYHFF